MFPTCVGMNRLSFTVFLVNPGVPHMRGDEPNGNMLQTMSVACSPHAWG